MAKMLTQVWKTFMGTFFETEEEARAAEDLMLIKRAVVAARKAALAPKMEEYRIKMAEYEKQSYTSRTAMPQNPDHTYQFPPNFVDHLVEELCKIAVVKDAEAE